MRIANITGWVTQMSSSHSYRILNSSPYPHWSIIISICHRWPGNFCIQRNANPNLKVDSPDIVGLIAWRSQSHTNEVYFREFHSEDRQELDTNPHFHDQIHARSCGRSRQMKSIRCLSCPQIRQRSFRRMAISWDFQRTSEHSEKKQPLTSL